MKNYRYWLIGVSLFWANPAAWAQIQPKHLQPQQAAQWLASDKNVVILDLRTPNEFRAGHLKNAVNVDYNAPNFEQQVTQLDRAKPYLLHCALGGRSTKALLVLQKLGFRDVRHLDGGFQAWQNAKLPVVR